MNSFTFCTYEFIYSMNSSVQNKLIHLIVVRAKPERERVARTTRAKPEPRGRSPSTPPALTRPRPAAPTVRVHPAAPTRPRPAVLTIRIHPAATIGRVHPAAPTS